MSSKWEQELMERLRDVLRDDARVRLDIDFARRELEQARSAVNGALALLDRIEVAVGEQAAARTGAIEAVLDERDDPVVLVRGYGDAGHYHSALRPCGWAGRNQDRYRSLLLGEALRRGLQKCKACGDRVEFDRMFAQSAR
jgi:hypothetical protein